MEYFIIGLICAFVFTKSAEKKGFDNKKFFIYTLVLWPISIIHLWLVEVKPKELVSGGVALKSHKICPNCGYAGDVSQVTKGSTLIELILWCCFIIPGLIYSVWRLTSRHDGCPQCGASNLVPLNSPRGKKLADEFGLSVIRPVNQSSENQSNWPQ